MRQPDALTDEMIEDQNMSEAREIAERFRLFGEKGFRPEVFGEDDRVPGPMVTRADCFAIAAALSTKAPRGWLYTLRGTQSYSPTRLPHCIALGWHETPLYETSPPIQQAKSEVEG